jgi:hypothetical protein
MDTPTPRTDAATKLVKGPNAWSPYEYHAVSFCVAKALERELSAATDTIDLMRDEFQRIKGCCVEDADVASEIQGICDRAMLNIVQRVPVIKQRDNAERRLGVAMTALHRIQYIWQVGSEACADNSRAGELMAEKAREAIAQLSGAARQ